MTETKKEKSGYIAGMYVYVLKHIIFILIPSVLFFQNAVRAVHKSFEDENQLILEEP